MGVAGFVANLGMNPAVLDVHFHQELRKSKDETKNCQRGS